MEKILIIEDDHTVANFLRVLISAQGYEVLEAKTANHGITLALSYNPDVIILDLGLPDMDGIDVISNIRDHVKSSILVVSAREKELDKISALDLGADDYLTKPFNSQELLARIRVALRHKQHAVDDKEEVYTIKDLKVDCVAHRVYIKTQEIHLSPIEFKILTLLISHHGKALTHAFLVKHVWGDSNLESDTQTLRVTMANLRRKIEQDPAQPTYILTEIGVGYRFIDS